MRVCLLTAAIVAMTAASATAEPAKVVLSPVMRTHMTVAGQEIVVPDHPDIVVSTATFPPGSRLAVHKHPYPHLVYVLQGVLTVVSVDTGKSFQVKAGDFVAEMQDRWHYGLNRGREPVRLLVIDEVPRGLASNVVPAKP